MKRREFVKTTAMCAGAIVAGNVAGQNLKDLQPGLLAEAKRIYEGNLVNSKLGVFHMPSAGSYPRFYAWDAGWHIISQSAFDLDTALTELESVFNFQCDDGMVAHEALIPELDKNKDGTYQRLGDKYFDADGRCRITDPP